MSQESNNMPAPPDYVRIQDRAQSVVDSMRQATAARNDSQTKAADFIAEQMERLAHDETELTATQHDRDGFEARLRQAEEAAAVELARYEREAAEASARHAKEVEGLVAQAASEITRLKEWGTARQGEMAAKQTELERANARLTLESERLSEENGILAQSAESLLAAIEESTQAMQRQDAVVEEAMRRSPPRPRPEGSVIRLLPNRARGDAPGSAAPISQVG